ncbi:MAG: tRNA ((37)-N6)-threonylcarbamoyltransferase complex dimerization subunit type 1 TsaB, partial [Pseudomonadota bacterium]
MARHILAFDTSAAHCAAALLTDDRIAASRFEPMEKGQAERLIPLLEDLLSDAGLHWRDLSALAVGTGPGNFTGVRIAVAAARGLALSLGIPALGVTRLQALAHGLPRPVMVVEDARRGEVYAQEFGTDRPDARLTAISALPRETGLL